MNLKLLTAIAALGICSGAWAQGWSPRDFYRAGGCDDAYTLTGDHGKSKKIEAEAERQALMSSLTKEDVWYMATVYRQGWQATDLVIWTSPEAQLAATEIIIEDNCAQYLGES